MVQNSRTQSPSIISIFGTAFIRVVLLIVVVVITWLTSIFFWEIIKNYLGYQTPEVFFSFVTDLVVIFGFGLIFWGSIMFGALGRRWDYLIIIVLTGWGFYSYTFIEEGTARMFLGLIGAAIIGNAIGFALKLLRQRFLPKLKV